MYLSTEGVRRLKYSHVLCAGIVSFALIVFMAPPPVPAQQSEQPVGESELSGFEWRNLGPANMSGRITGFAVAERGHMPDEIYVGAASGGVFKSSDQGQTWKPVFDDVEAPISVGAVAVAPSNPNVVWVGTGEPNNRQSSPWGEGVYRSVDGGTTWQLMGLEETRHIGRIVVHPTDPSVVYVAAVGHLWGSNPERGVFRTTDGGETWERVLFVDEHTGAVDLAIDPEDPKTLFAAMYQRQRRAWGFIGGGSGSGIYRTTDGGDQWQELTDGIPVGNKGRIGLDVFRQDGRIVYAVIEASGDAGGVYRSEDRGDSWVQVNDLNPRPMYFSQIRIDPSDPSRIYLAGNSIRVSDDGGEDFTDPGYGVTGVHPDQHALWVDPENPNHVLAGSDGGVYVSWNRARSWKFVENLPVGQFYEISVDQRDPYWICGGLQDNASWCLPSEIRRSSGITNGDVRFVGSGDGFNAIVSRRDKNTIFTESQGGDITRFDLATHERQIIKPVPEEKPDDDEEDSWRWDWNSPYTLSEHDPSTVYVGANVVFRSRDEGRTWEIISPDLTSEADRDTLMMMGRTADDSTLSEHDGTSSYPNLTEISESPRDETVLYAGSDDGLLHVTINGGEDWTEVGENIEGLPARTYVSKIIASQHADGRVYAAFDGHYHDDYRPHLYVSEDYGRSWQSISNGLPSSTSINVVKEHPDTPELLFVGHEKGIHVSLDRGQTWMALNQNMPTVPVDDIEIHPRENDLVVGTHGRGIWVLDEIAALESLVDLTASQEPSFLEIQPAEIIRGGVPGWFEVGHFTAPNPPRGAIIRYYIPDSSAFGGSIRLRVISLNGDTVRTMSAPASTGINQVVWDLRLDPPYPPEPGAEFGLFSHPPRGPYVLPGEYRVEGRGVATDVSMQGTLSVIADPKTDFSEAERQEQHRVVVKLYGLQKQLHHAEDVASKAVEQVEASLTTIRQQAAADSLSGVADSLSQAADSLRSVRDNLDDQLGTVTGLKEEIGGYSGPPRSDQMRQIEWAFDDSAEQFRAFNQLVSERLPALYARLEDGGEWPVRRLEVPTHENAGSGNGTGAP